jgi:hypothetical protein
MSIASLPDEILAYIFEYCVEGDTGHPGGEGLGFSPRTLALVNRNWYRVASATASLWRAILVADIPNIYWTIQRNWRLPPTEITKFIPTHSAMQVCTTQGALERALHRTQGTSLDITLGLNYYFNQGQHLLFHRVYSTLFSDYIRPRITRLTIDRCDIPDTFISLFDSMPVCLHLPNLVSLTIEYPGSRRLMPGGESMLRLILENAGNLKDISLIGGLVPECLKAEVWQNASYSSTIRNLRRLTLGNPISLLSMFNDIMPIPELVIRMAARIECLGEANVWDAHSFPWPGRYTRELTFTSVTSMHLVLDDLSPLSRIDFPVLESLRLSQSSQYRMGERFGEMDPPIIPDFVVNLPRLRSLRIMTDQFAPLSRLQVPRLESLHLTSTLVTKRKTGADLSSLFPEPPTQIAPLAEESNSALNSSFFHPLQSIHTLYLNAYVSEEPVLQALRSLPSLRVLSLVLGKNLGRVLVHGLTVKRSRSLSTVKSLLCPDLEVIELDLVSFIEWNRTGQICARAGTATLTTLPATLEKCVAARRKAGKPLQRCTVIDKQGKREYAKCDV